MSAGLETAPPAPPPPRRRPLSGGDLHAVAVWVLSRLAVVLLVAGGARLLSGQSARDVEPFLQRWDRWDVGLFTKVAEFGYQGYPDSYTDRGIEAFFPGFPLLLRVVHVVVPDWVAAGLLVSLVAGTVAAVALSRLAEHEGSAGSRAVLYLVLSPYAVFLAAGYSEALFLALALPGWLLAQRGRWVQASLLVALATSVRVSGVFLAAGRVVQYAVVHRGRPRPDAVALLAPFAVAGAYGVYLWTLTGDWLRWSHAQEEGWQRRSTLPWDALSTTLAAARDLEQGAEYTFNWWAEIAAVAVGITLTVALLALRRYGEATYVGLSVGALATSTFYLSVARATLLWFPLFLLLAAASRARPWVHTAYVAVCAPLMALLVLTFTSGRWTG